MDLHKGVVVVGKADGFRFPPVDAAKIRFHGTLAVPAGMMGMDVHVNDPVQGMVRSFPCDYRATAYSGAQG